jgi:hypothetical protein
MGVWLNEPAFRHPERIDQTIRNLAAAGYAVVRLFLRHSNYGYLSPEVVAAVRRAAELAHSLGMRAVLDCEPHVTAGQEMGRRYPEAMGTKLLATRVPVIAGRWQARVASPDQASATFDGVEAAFLTSGGATQAVELTWQANRETHAYDNGNLHREMEYVEGRPMNVRAMWVLSGKLPQPQDGELMIYWRFACRTLSDFWAEGFRRYYDDLLAAYRDVPLDGIGWDEPAVDGNWETYRYGDGFAAAFERLNGYRLRDRLYLLDAPGAAPEAVKTRLDYYRTLNEGLAQAQANLIAKARQLFGPELILGTHHTWQGEGGINDYRAGAVDYFRLNDNMDAGYTDCCWWDPPSVSYAYMLGSSLGRLTPSGEAEANTWHFKPTVANTRRNVNLMALLDITWFDIWCGSDCDTSFQEGHIAWPEVVDGAQKLSRWQRQIGTRRPVVEVAVWHGWEGVCAWNRSGLANAQKAFCLNSSHLLIQRSIAADYIDSRLLAESRIENGRLVNRLGAYAVLVMPYALALPRAAFAKCVEFARAGGRVVFVGTPVCCDENGVSLVAEFAALLAMPPLAAEPYMRGLEAVCTLPDYRPQRLEICRPLDESLPNKLVSMEGEVHGVTGPGGHAVFLTDLDPQHRLLEHLEDVLNPAVRAYGDNLLWRLYRGEGEGDLLVVAARDEQPLRGIVFWQDRVIELAGGRVGLISLTDGKLTMAGDAVIRQNDEKGICQ